MIVSGIPVSDSFIHTLGWTLLHSLWQGLLIYLLYRILLIFIRPSHLKTRYTVSIIAFLFIPILAAVTFTLLYPEPHVQHGITTAKEQVNPIARKVSILFQYYTGDLLPGPVSFQTLYKSILTFINGHLDFIAFGWMVGMMIFRWLTVKTL